LGEGRFEQVEVGAIWILGQEEAVVKARLSEISGDGKTLLLLVHFGNTVEISSVLDSS
jgi:hypothetical protein